MGDPQYFSIKGGANPHTRDLWGRRKTVDKSRAIDQWLALKALLEQNGLQVWVVPPDPQWPGTVYPANAGFILNAKCGIRNAESSVIVSAPVQFYLSNLLPSRAGEQALYRQVLEVHGIACHHVSFRFEGEADFFPSQAEYFFTCGPIERQRFVPHWGLPPWKRVYGFRSDENGANELRSITHQPIRTIRLTRETHYHGDTVLCAFGPQREYVLAYLEGLEPAAAQQLQADYSKRLIPLCEADAHSYAANSFQFIRNGQVFLVMHQQVSRDLLKKLRGFKVEPLLVDVSEFLKKGGGSVKCMIGDLGRLAA